MSGSNFYFLQTEHIVKKSQDIEAELENEIQA